MTFWGSLLVFAAIALAAVVTGRLLAGALGLRLLRHFDAASAAASAVLGSGVLIWLSALLSDAGLTGQQIARLLSAPLAALALVCWLRRAGSVFRPRGPRAAWLGLAAIVVLAAVVALLPVARTNGFFATGDMITYCSVADWMHDH